MTLLASFRLVVRHLKFVQFKEWWNATKVLYCSLDPVGIFIHKIIVTRSNGIKAFSHHFNLMNPHIYIECIAEGYKETCNYRAFTYLSLLSQVGGFIGMFLGYSLLHLPQFAGFIANAAKSMVCKNEKIRTKMAWNNIKRKKTRSKMNLVDIKGFFDHKVENTIS